MEITVKGKNDKLSPKEVKHALEFFGWMLLGSRLAKNVYVDVVFEPKVMRMKHEKYFSMPWEKEAHISEDYLLDYYKQYRKSQKNEKA